MVDTAPPDWPHCGHGADPTTDPVGCRGFPVPGHTTCLCHLADRDRSAYFAGLAPGAAVDHRGTTFDKPLLSALLEALRDPSSGYPRVGDAQFREATFSSALVGY